MNAVRSHEQEIVAYAYEKLLSFPGVTMYGPEKVEDRGGLIAFTMDGIHAHDVSQILAEDNICIRAGHHCAMPLHTELGIKATARISFYVYTTREDIDAFIEGLKKVKKTFK